MKKITIIFIVLFCKIYATGNLNNFELGCGIYRELDTGTHWHAALFNYFEFRTSDKNGVMHWTNQPGLSGGDVNNRKKSEPLSIDNYASDLSYLKNEFIDKFSGSNNYYGSFSTQITPSKRAEIVSLGRDLTCVEKYCVSKMLDNKGFDWDGSKSDIDEIRCDGVVEFAYEKKNIIVSNPPFNICTDDFMLGIHNDLHTFGYNWPELCPRIQSGEGHGGNSTNASFFNPLVSSNPVIDYFSTSTPITERTQINIKIKDNASVKAYVLLLVRKVGTSDWYVLKDIYNNTWEFREISLTDYNAGYQYDQFFIQWSGNFVGHGAFYQDGNYELKIVVVDQGANYSEQTNNFYADVNDNNAIEINLTKFGTSTINANVTGGVGLDHSYTWWYRSDGLVANKNEQKAPPSGQWIYNSTWDDMVSIDFSPNYNFSVKCLVEDICGGTDEDIYTEEISPILIKNVKTKNISQIPSNILLFNNYPNPFNPITQIKYGIPITANVDLKIYSISGELVKTLVNNIVSAGYHSVSWNATDEKGAKVSSGIYIYQLKCGNEVYTNRMIFTK